MWYRSTVRAALVLGIVGWMLVAGGDRGAGWARSAAAAPPPAMPEGPHPRMLLDRELRGAWRAAARGTAGAVPHAVEVCRAAAAGELEDAQYQGAAWAQAVQGCLVAWAATDRDEHARTAIRFFTALIDDLDRVGDGRGGDASAQRDHGYAIRNLGPYTALAYDWLHGHPAMTPALRARARQRWAAWLDWYRASGYRPRHPGTNYHAGYLVAATLIAVAQAGEAGEPGEQLWRYVADELWAKDMAAALAAGGILDGGDWPEGWQYGPLAVASYALAARVARAAGIPVPGVEAWLSALLRRHVYGLSPSDQVHVGQDTQAESATVGVNPLTLAAIALGDAARDDRRWARGELARLGLLERSYVLFDSLAAGAPEQPAPVPRAQWPTWYTARATQTLFARTRWDARAVWLVAECAPALDVDHRQPKAGNFILTRGPDHVIVDPSPYGALSSLTSNAPTVASAQLPERYIPSQGPWSERTSWDWATQSQSGVVAVRCDYSDQYRFQHRPSDVPGAMRDLVMLPSADGTDAVVIVYDRADTGGAHRPMLLRFRSPAALELAGDRAAAKLGQTTLSIANVRRTDGALERVAVPAGDCFKGDPPRGRCDAARFPVIDLRLKLSGPRPAAIHAITATGGAGAAVATLTGKGWEGVRVDGVRPAAIVWPTKAREGFTYRAPRTARTHVIFDAPELGEKTSLTGRVEGSDCVMTAAASAAEPTIPAHPVIALVDEACTAVADPEARHAPTSGTQPAAQPRPPPAPRRSGCCGAQASPEAPLAMAAVVGALLLRRRRRPRR